MAWLGVTEDTRYGCKRVEVAQWNPGQLPVGDHPAYTSPQPTEPVKVPNEADAKHVQDFINCDGMGAVIVEGPQYSAVVRALLARFGQPSKES